MITDLFAALIKWVAICGAFIGGLFWVFKRGKKEQRAESNEQIIEDVYLAKQARDRLKHDDDYADRVRERFRE